MIGMHSFVKKAAAAKLLAAIGVVTLGVGGTAAAVAGLPGSSDDAPALVDENSNGSSSDSSTDESSDTSSTDESSTSDNHGQLVSDFAHTTELEGCERGQAIAEVASGGRHEAKPCGEDSSDDESSESSTGESSTDESSTDESSSDESSTDESSTEESNHGQIVSDFVHSTELEGCEKGQATAELASDGRHEAKDCGGDDESGDGSSDDADDDADEVTASNSAPTDAGHGKSDQAPGRSGDKPGNGKGHDD